MFELRDGSEETATVGGSQKAPLSFMPKFNLMVEGFSLNFRQDIKQASEKFKANKNWIESQKFSFFPHQLIDFLLASQPLIFLRAHNIS